MADRVLRLLDASRVRRLTAVLALACAIAYVAILAGSKGLRLPSGDFAFGDLRCLLTSGKLALGGDLTHLYEPRTQAHVQSAMVSPEATLDLYLSPPFMAWVWAPLAALPFFTAGVVWNTITAALGVVSARLVAMALDRSALAIALVLFAAEPLWQTLVMGQDSAIALVLYGGALLAWRRKRELLAGVLIGVGSFKPQLFWLVPVALLAARRWRALGGFVVTAAALASLSLMLVGWAGAKQYVWLLQSPLYHVQIDVHLAMTMGLPTFVKMFLGAPWAAILSVIAAAWVTAIVWRGARENPSRLIGLAALGSMLAAPHGFVYDAIVLLVPLAELHAEDPRRGTLATASVVALTWLIPITRDFSTAPWPTRVIATPWTTVAVAIAFGFYVASLGINWRSLRTPRR
jgi:hypothetical protein